MLQYNNWSYVEYLECTNKTDSRLAWIAWKMEVCGMNPKEAEIAAYDREWGWSPLKDEESVVS